MATETDVLSLGRIPDEPGFVAYGDQGKAVVDVLPENRGCRSLAAIIETIIHG